MWIDGKWVDADSGKTFRTYNQANGEAIAKSPLTGKSDVEKLSQLCARHSLPGPKDCRLRQKKQEE
jgi:acyl-CoA reductase-like NAD-dependent aldehyde dehydrogenase